MTKVPRVMARSITAILLAVVLAAGLGKAAAAQDFVPGFEDIPLMRGLTAVPDRGHVFDAPSGRLVESFAEGRVSRVEVLEFYRRTLPALGWRPEAATAFRRDDETLAIGFEGDDGDLLVRFNLAPRQ